MTIEELEEWKEEFEQFHAGFADLFERQESHEQAKRERAGGDGPQLCHQACSRVSGSTTVSIS
jgi:hypothetical protein